MARAVVPNNSKVGVIFTVHDVLELRPKMTVEQAALFLEENQEYIKNEMAQVGRLAMMGLLTWKEFTNQLR